VVEGIGCKIQTAEQVHVIEMFKVFPFHFEDLDLNNPELVYKVIQNLQTNDAYYGTTVASSRSSEKNCKAKGKNVETNTFYNRYSLKKRPYLGPTSTDHELALLMANQAKCTAGDLVYDPFVGTGSIALAC